MTPTDLRLLYVVYDGITNSAFDSQVLRYLQGLQARGIEVMLCAFDPPSQVRGSRYHEKQVQVRRLLDGAAQFRVRLPVLGRPSVRVDAWTLARQMAKWSAQDSGQRIVHCRSVWASYLALTAQRKRQHLTPVVADIRGDVAAEYQLYESIPLLTVWKTHEVRHVERLVCEQADHVLCVSTPLRECLRRSYGLATEKVTVVPTCVETRRFRFEAKARAVRRQELGLTERLVVVYNGGIRGWQNPGGLVETFRTIKRHEPTAHFLVLTPGVKQMVALLRASCVPESAWTVLRVTHVEIPSYLMCADVGLLIREQNPVNRVASPTKFAEYLACGVPVLVSAGIGDTHAIVEEYGVGLVWDAATDLAPFLARVTRQREELAADCQRVARQHYDLDIHLDRLVEVYRRVLAIREQV